MKHVQVFPTAESLGAAAADFIVHIARKAVQETGRFTLSLSGGHTPDKLFALLAAPPFREQIPWKNTLVFWGDERCVPFDDERSNARMAHTTLLDHVEIPAANIFRVPVHLTPQEAARQYEQTIREVFGPASPRFDLILLGLGNDGHTASLFPGTEVLQEQAHWVQAVYADAQQMYRITMTLPLINQARNILFLVAGKEKAEILKQVLDVGTPPETYPAQLVRPDTGELYWFVDAGAAGNLYR